MGRLALRADAGSSHRLVLVVGGMGVRESGWLRLLLRVPGARALAWGGGTYWYAKRRGRWPSALSARLFAPLLGKRNPATHVALPATAAVLRRDR
jgi:hypothetical protein